jgi:RNA polymerase sigma factor (sigma-70 family)
VTPAERFDELFRDHHAPILRYLQRRTGPSEAADLAAEVFLVAWRRLADAPTDEARLWLYGVAHHVLSNHRRGQRRRAHLAVQLADALRRATPADEATALTLQVRAALATLPADDREVLTLTVWEELRPAEIAAVIGMEPGAVRVRLHRARSRLHAALATTDDDPVAVCEPSPADLPA